MSTEELINTNIYFCRVSSYQELFFHCLHAMLSSTHHIDIQYRQHVFLLILAIFQKYLPKLKDTLLRIAPLIK